MRILISEGKLVRIVPRWVVLAIVTKKVCGPCPVAAISTTTKNRLEIDEETAVLSIWVNESAEHTREIVRDTPNRITNGVTGNADLAHVIAF